MGIIIFLGIILVVVFLVANNSTADHNDYNDEIKVKKVKPLKDKIYMENQAIEGCKTVAGLLEHTRDFLVRDKDTKKYHVLPNLMDPFSRTKNQMIVVEFYETIRNLLRYKYDNYPDGSNNKEASGNFIDLWESIFEHYTNQGDAWKYYDDACENGLERVFEGLIEYLKSAHITR